MSDSPETQERVAEQSQQTSDQNEQASEQNEQTTDRDDGDQGSAQEEKAQDPVIQHLRDVHALEEQSIRQLERAAELADDELKSLYEEHLEQTREHEQLIKERIEAHDLEPSAVADLTMRSGAIGLRQLADVAPDTPVKLAMHFYAFEHLEIAAYEFLARIARGNDDSETADVAERILEQEREAAEKVGGTFDRSAELCLQAEKQEG